MAARRCPWFPWKAFSKAIAARPDARGGSVPLFSAGSAMRIRVCHVPRDRDTGEIISTALVRSFSSAQVECDDFFAADAGCAVWINPPAESTTVLRELLRR